MEGIVWRHLLHPGAEITLLQNMKYAKKPTARADYHWFWRENENDAVYRVLGGSSLADLR